MKIRLILAVLVLAVIGIGRADEAARWEIDPAHSSIEFTVRHLMVSKAKGSFERFAGSAVGDPKQPGSASVEVTIDAASITTQNADRDRHLRSADFFDVEKHPRITFKSKQIVEPAGGILRIVGDLTMHGITREVALNVERLAPANRDGTARFQVVAKTKLNRKDFDIVWNQMLDGGGVAVSEDVNVLLSIELVKK